MTNRPFVASPRWTPEEEDRLRILAYEGKRAAVIAELLNRKIAAVWSRAHKLGISLKQVGVRKRYR